MDVRGHSGIAKSADQNGVEVAGQHLKAIWRNGDAVLEVTVRAPVEVAQVNRRLRSLDYLDRLGNDFLADAIAWDDGNFLVGAHAGKVSQMEIGSAQELSRVQPVCETRLGRPSGT